MRLLLDTHALLWWLDGDNRLSPRVRALVGDENITVFVSAASALEIATKVRIGKLPGAVEVVEHFPEVIAQQGFKSLDISIAHAKRAGLLPGKHRDPFDRMLVAQSQIEDVALVSNEKIFDAFGINRLW